MGVACATPVVRSPAVSERGPASVDNRQTARQTVCDAGSVGWRSYRYCLSFNRESKSTAILYYLHGVGGDENSWSSAGHQTLEASWKARGIEEPAILTITLGSTWFLSEESGMFSRSTADVFVNGLIPSLEALLPQKPKERVLLGESMGGFNGIQLLAKTPTLWSRAALVCPAITAVGPQATPMEVEEFITRQKPFGRRDLIERWLGKLKVAFPTKPIWAKHNPIVLAQSASVDSPKVLIVGHAKDEFGFFEATAEFYDQLKNRGVRAEMVVALDQGHCQHNRESLERLGTFLF